MSVLRVPVSRRTAILLTVLVICLVAAVVAVLWPREHRLHGLLLDLELDRPDPSRHEKLRETFTRRLPSEIWALRNCSVTVEYAHFSTFAGEAVNRGKIDFLIFSPQGTPWHMYNRDSAPALDRLKDFVKEIISKAEVPMLGICGGHQFLVLALGGTVDFIDPAFAGKFPERYPKEALSERGVVLLETLAEDPIFASVASHPGSFRVVESHYEEVKRLPEPFVNLAASAMSRNQLIRIPGKCVYGFAFHPERCWDDKECPGSAITEGRRLLGNFLLMVARRRS